jgi:hypothetical protein
MFWGQVNSLFEAVEKIEKANRNQPSAGEVDLKASSLRQILTRPLP